MQSLITILCTRNTRNLQTLHLTKTNHTTHARKQTQHKQAITIVITENARKRPNSHCLPITMNCVHLKNKRNRDISDISKTHNQFQQMTLFTTVGHQAMIMRDGGPNHDNARSFAQTTIHTIRCSPHICQFQ